MSLPRLPDMNPDRPDGSPPGRPSTSMPRRPQRSLPKGRKPPPAMAVRPRSHEGLVFPSVTEDRPEVESPTDFIQAYRRRAGTANTAAAAAQLSTPTRTSRMSRVADQMSGPWNRRPHHAPPRPEEEDPFLTEPGLEDDLDYGVLSTLPDAASTPRVARHKSPPGERRDRGRKSRWRRKTKRSPDELAEPPPLARPPLARPPLAVQDANRPMGRQGGKGPGRTMASSPMRGRWARVQVFRGSESANNTDELG